MLHSGKKIKKKKTASASANGVKSSPSASTALGKAFPECTIFDTRGRCLSRGRISRRLFPECCTRGRLPRVQLGLPRVQLALGEASSSCSVLHHISYIICMHLGTRSQRDAKQWPKGHWSIAYSPGMHAPRHLDLFYELCKLIMCCIYACYLCMTITHNAPTSLAFSPCPYPCLEVLLVYFQDCNTCLACLDQCNLSMRWVSQE